MMGMSDEGCDLPATCVTCDVRNTPLTNTMHHNINNQQSPPYAFVTRNKVQLPPRTPGPPTPKQAHA